MARGTFRAECLVVWSKPDEIGVKFVRLLH